MGFLGFFLGLSGILFVECDIYFVGERGKWTGEIEIESKETLLDMYSSILDSFIRRSMKRREENAYCSFTMTTTITFNLPNPNKIEIVRVASQRI